MKKKELAILGVLLVAVVIVVTVASSASQSNISTASAAAVTEPPIIPGNIPGGDPLDPAHLTGRAEASKSAVAGSPAIKSKKAANALEHGVNAVNIAESDIRDYLANNYVAGFTYNRAQTTISQIELITRQELNTRIHGDGLNLPDAKKIYLVTLTGSFKSMVSPASVTFSKIYVVFDAETGNYLVGTA